MNIGGLDLSTTRCGYAAPNGTVHSITPDKRVSRAQRLVQLRGRIAKTIMLNPPIPHMIVIEGYGFGVNHATSARLGELGGVIRVYLYEKGIAWVEVSPASLKLFSCGSGRVEKHAMVKAAVELGGPRGLNDDEADAWHLRRMGRIAVGLQPITAAYESQALADCKVDWPVFA